MDFRQTRVVCVVHADKRSLICWLTNLDLTVMHCQTVGTIGGHFQTWLRINLLWPSDTIWCYNCGSTAVHQARNSCLKAPRYLQISYWFRINKIIEYTSKHGFNGNSVAVSHKCVLENYISKMTIVPGNIEHPKKYIYRDKIFRALNFQMCCIDLDYRVMA